MNPESNSSTRRNSVSHSPKSNPLAHSSNQTSSRISPQLHYPPNPTSPIGGGYLDRISPQADYGYRPKESFSLPPLSLPPVSPGHSSYHTQQSPQFHLPSLNSRSAPSGHYSSGNYPAGVGSTSPSSPLPHMSNPTHSSWDPSNRPLENDSRQHLSPTPFVNNEAEPYEERYDYSYPRGSREQLPQPENSGYLKGPEDRLSSRWSPSRSPVQSQPHLSYQQNEDKSPRLNVTNTHWSTGSNLNLTQQYPPISSPQTDPEASRWSPRHSPLLTTSKSATGSSPKTENEEDAEKRSSRKFSIKHEAHGIMSISQLLSDQNTSKYDPPTAENEPRNSGNADGEFPKEFVPSWQQSSRGQGDKDNSVPVGHPETSRIYEASSNYASNETTLDNRSSRYRSILNDDEMKDSLEIPSRGDTVSLKQDVSEGETEATELTDLGEELSPSVGDSKPHYESKMAISKLSNDPDLSNISDMDDSKLAESSRRQATLRENSSHKSQDRYKKHKSSSDRKRNAENSTSEQEDISILDKRTNDGISKRSHKSSSKHRSISHKFKKHAGVSSSESSGDELEGKSRRRSKKWNLNSSSEEDSTVEDELVNKLELIRYMVSIHRRHQKILTDYEKRCAKKKKRLQRRFVEKYEQRFGIRRAQISDDDDEEIVDDVPALKTEEVPLSESRNHIYPKSTETHFQDESIIEEVPEIVGSKEDDFETLRHRTWLSIARKHVPKVSRILAQSVAVRSTNSKKIAQLCQREVKKAAYKTVKLHRELPNKSKRAMREMLIFWKKNEKEERELRKKAEKEALERMKIEEELRESRRQARKLNFLITQTELYSHFIGKKIAPQSEDIPGSTNSEMQLSGENEKLEEIDFDDDDEEKLKEHARKSAQNALKLQAEKTREFDEAARQRRAEAEAEGGGMAVSQDDLDQMNFLNPTSMPSEPEVPQPKMLMCQLKNYQLKGLSWLANLYDQGINGILADEMGLGKTVQSISLLAHLAEAHNIWGPFLVIAPASTLHNWQQEVSRFVPGFKALPYWGSIKDRKVLRKFWSKKQLYSKDAPFHVLITSYQLIVTDEKYFQRVKWQYMVLDEAQAIKSSTSARWKTLLGFNCRNRLLLTGTPIQNSMQELWALLHFIMPTLFDSHEEFSEWFSRDIENHAENKGSLNEHQLKRLHMILKPFMLRRIKRNVQNELGEKIELEVDCELTARQRTLYKALKEKISVSELMERVNSLSENDGVDSLMNLVMQFRKVCNHPELFERADVSSPLAFCEYIPALPLNRDVDSPYVPYSAKNLITYTIPKRLYRNGGILRNVGDHSSAGIRNKYLHVLFSIWRASYINDSLFGDDKSTGCFSFLRFVNISPAEAEKTFFADVLRRWISHLVTIDTELTQMNYIRDADCSYRESSLYDRTLFALKPIQQTFFTNLDPVTNLVKLSEVVSYDYCFNPMKKHAPCYITRATAPCIEYNCSDKGFVNEQRDLMFSQEIRALLMGVEGYVPSHQRNSYNPTFNFLERTERTGVLGEPFLAQGFSNILVPSMLKFITDSGKLHTLDKLLVKLKAEGHRVLVYFQMTRMIDLMEEYLTFRQHSYLRLDGSSKISDRRDMVMDWQTRPDIFVFLLSTRAGGLGINLTAADTVIFYDSDWNPTVDQQAMDRAHRLGQTRQVTVYRLITKGTIEEKILIRAKQKDEIQKVVISGGEFKQNVDFKAKEIVSLLLDDDEIEKSLKELKKNGDGETKAKKSKPKKSEGAPSKNKAISKRIEELWADGEPTFQSDSSDVSSNTSTGSKRKKPVKSTENEAKKAKQE
ncbi:putative DNA helicase ino80 [Basidiobolus ranarum]|uniref:Chromatin-remodeling ATPase INO80 n=1 Tax=Basidiobolus ranarum TaxID=34480 RepID=A0ABR2W4U5_9FUNG